MLNVLNVAATTAHFAIESNRGLYNMLRADRRASQRRSEPSFAAEFFSEFYLKMGKPLAQA
jgi:hypothetical protein